MLEILHRNRRWLILAVDKQVCTNFSQIYTAREIIRKPGISRAGQILYVSELQETLYLHDVRTARAVPVQVNQNSRNVFDYVYRLSLHRLHDTRAIIPIVSGFRKRNIYSTNSRIIHSFIYFTSVCETF